VPADRPERDRVAAPRRPAAAVRTSTTSAGECAGNNPRRRSVSASAPTVSRSACTPVPSACGHRLRAAFGEVKPMQRMDDGGVWWMVVRRLVLLVVVTSGVTVVSANPGRGAPTPSTPAGAAVDPILRATTSIRARRDERGRPRAGYDAPHRGTCGRQGRALLRLGRQRCHCLALEGRVDLRASRTTTAAMGPVGSSPPPALTRSRGRARR
jgi:hypothetical protein